MENVEEKTGIEYFEFMYPGLLSHLVSTIYGVYGFDRRKELVEILMKEFKVDTAVTPTPTERG